jgi:TfoX/Sxy family transcriptional regulator of competence genes
MSTQQSTVDTILSHLSDLDVRSRKMFGEYGLYCNDKVVGFICDDTLFVKILPQNEDLASGLETGPCYPGSKPYYIVPPAKYDNEWLQEFIQVTADAVPKKTPKKK